MLETNRHSPDGNHRALRCVAGLSVIAASFLSQNLSDVPPAAASTPVFNGFHCDHGALVLDVTNPTDQKTAILFVATQMQQGTSDEKRANAASALADALNGGGYPLSPGTRVELNGAGTKCATAAQNPTTSVEAPPNTLSRR